MGLPTWSNGTQCDASAGAGAALPIPLEGCTERNLAGDTLAGLPGFNVNPVKALRADRAQTTRGDSSLEFPNASARTSAQAGALGTLTVAAIIAALIDKLEAATSEPFLQTDPIEYEDLHHGTLLIGPRGGKAGTIVLDDPELTVVVGPPQAGFPVQQVANSAADMIALLGFSEAVNAIYQLGQADPMTTGSTGPTTQHAETQFFMPDGPTIGALASSGGLPPLLPEQLPNTNGNPPTGGFSNFPGEQPTQPKLAFEVDKDLLSHDEQVQTGGEVNIGTPGDPFVNTAGSVFGAGNIVVTLEAKSDGAPSGLSVTGGGPIFLFKEIIAGNVVVVGRDSSDEGAIAFIISITPDGATLSVEQQLPIDHSGGGDILSIINDALLVRVTINDGTTSLSQTLPIGDRVAFEDDEPVATDESAEVTTASFNIAFVLDFSGSISNSNFNTMLDAVTEAGQAFFNNSTGNTSITLIRFASGANTIGTYTDFASFEAALNIDPNDRGISTGATNYTAAIEETMDSYVPDIDAVNRVFFFSDGQPTQDLGSGHSLQSDTRAAWNSFVAESNISVQTIGVAGATETALKQVDEADGDNAVILIDSFDELVGTLLALANTASGNVLDNDSFGSDGPGFVKTLKYDSDDDGVLNDEDVTYRFDGTDIYLGDDVVVEGENELTFETESGGSFTFNFETGAWNYTSPDTFTEPFVERFGYTIADGDHDVSGLATLSIAVSPPGSSAIESLLASAQNPSLD